MSGDPLVAHFAREHQRTRQAWWSAGICQFWIWLNALGALAFRFWVVDQFNFTTFVEEKLWPSGFLFEGLLQLCVTILVCMGLVRIPRDKNLWGFFAAAIFTIAVNSIIVMAWALVIVPEEYRLAATFALYGSYLTIPALAFAVYSAIGTPSPSSLWIYAITITVAMKCAAVILTGAHSLAFISYTVIIVIAIASVVLPLRFALAKTDSRTSVDSDNKATRDDAAA
jgi:hypothetical protein